MEPDQSPRRRATDPLMADMQRQIDHLHECIESVKLLGADNKAALAENTKITQEVRDILATFKVVGAIAKWLGIVATGATAAYHGWMRITGR